MQGLTWLNAKDKHNIEYKRKLNIATFSLGGTLAIFSGVFFSLIYYLKGNDFLLFFNIILIFLGITSLLWLYFYTNK